MVLLLQKLVYIQCLYIVDVHASNSMARKLVYGIVIIAGWIPKSFHLINLQVAS